MRAVRTVNTIMRISFRRARIMPFPSRRAYGLLRRLSCYVCMRARTEEGSLARGRLSLWATSSSAPRVQSSGTLRRQSRSRSRPINFAAPSPVVATLILDRPALSRALRGGRPQLPAAAITYYTYGSLGLFRGKVRRAKIFIDRTNAPRVCFVARLFFFFPDFSAGSADVLAIVPNSRTLLH